MYLLRGVKRTLDTEENLKKPAKGYEALGDREGLPSPLKTPESNKSTILFSNEIEGGEVPRPDPDPFRPSSWQRTWRCFCLLGQPESPLHSALVQPPAPSPPRRVAEPRGCKLSLVKLLSSPQLTLSLAKLQQQKQRLLLTQPPATWNAEGNGAEGTIPRPARRFFPVYVKISLFEVKFSKKGNYFWMWGGWFGVVVL